VRYDGGRMMEAITRGDGTVGEEVTANARTIRSLPLRIAHTGPIEARGEVIMPRAAIRASQCRTRSGLDCRYSPIHATRRGRRTRARSGGHRRARRLTYFSYMLFPPQPEHSKSLDWLSKPRIQRQHASQVCKGIVEVQKFCDHWDEARHKLPYETDGVVGESKFHRFAARTWIHVKSSTLGHGL